MSESHQQTIKDICQSCGNDRTRLMDVVIALQKSVGCVTSDAMDMIAAELQIPRIDVESVVSFYAFLSKDPMGKTVIRLCNDPVDKMKGFDQVAEVFQKELGIGFHGKTEDGEFSLEQTPCIGMCDQAPAALINDVIVTNLTAEKAQAIINELKQNNDPLKLSLPLGDGNNANDLVRSSVQNNICKKGPVIFGEHHPEEGLKKALELTPDEVIREVKSTGLRGRGGAGFPTGLKWEFTRAAKSDKKFILCNADEGEPGTFKDRVLLTERFDLIVEGMTIGAYAIGAGAGIIYVRGEYAYLKNFLDNLLQKRREQGLLGKNILGKEGFDFDVRIQLGAGAYICGEETSLISSCEGLRGDPKTRPPFPAHKGYLGYSTSVNNVETFCCVARIFEMGVYWFDKMGTKGSPGTKVLSVSGDCANSGIYEMPFGIKIRDVLKEAGALDAQAVLIGGPSGRFVGSEDFDKTVCYDDLATGGAFVIFGPQRDILKMAREYMEFFVEESCGYCAPCRAGNVLLKKCLDKIIDGQGEPADLDYLQDLGESVKMTSRCGLGQTSPNPILTTLKHFRPLYEAVVKENQEGFDASFDIKAALKDAEQIAGRKSVIY